MAAELKPAAVAPAGSGAAKCQTGHSDRTIVVREFLRTLFGAKPAELYVLIWLLAAKVSHWFKDLDPAEQFVLTHADEQVYFGFALSPDDFGPKNRCTANRVAGTVGLAVDIDIFGPGHTNKALPPDVDSAVKILPPDLSSSYVIDSAGGLHVYWLWKEPWIFNGEAERTEAAELNVRFEGFLRSRAAEYGWTIDSVHDLARVFRVPGTMNLKIPGEPRPVTVLSSSDARYNPSEIKEYLDEMKAVAPDVVTKPTAKNHVNTADFVLDPDANPPFNKFEVVLRNERLFAESWLHQRTDMKDQSASAYDLSVAIFPAIYRWSKQEIVNLIIARRRNHGDDLKLRPDYYARTLAKAQAAADKYWSERDTEAALEFLRTGSVQDHAAESQDIVEDSVTANSNDHVSTAVAADVTAAETPMDHTKPDQCSPQELPDPATTRKDKLEKVSKVLGVEIVRVIKFTGNPGQYRVETPGGAAQLGNVNGLISQSKLRAAIADAARVYTRPVDPEDWPRVAQALLDAIEELDRGPEATLHGRVTGNLLAFLNERQVLPSVDEAHEHGDPFLQDGYVWIFVDSFLEWLRNRRGERMAKNTLTAELRAYGAVPAAVPLTINGKRTTRSAWMLPVGPWDEVPGIADSE